MSVQSILAESPEALIARLAAAGRAAQRVLARLDAPAKAAALHAAAAALRAHSPSILAANARDLVAGEANGLSAALLDRLRLDSVRLAAIAEAVDQVAELPDPVGQVIDSSLAPQWPGPQPRPGAGWADRDRL